MDATEPLPEWLPEELQEILALQAASFGDDTPLNLCICAEPVYLQHIEDALTSVYDNPLALTVKSRSTLVQRDTDDVGMNAIDGLIVKSSSRVTLEKFESIPEEIPRVEFDQTGGTPKFPKDIPVLLLVEPDDGVFDPYYAAFGQIPVEGAVINKFHFTIPFTGSVDAQFDAAVTAEVVGNGSESQYLLSEVIRLRGESAPEHISSEATQSIEEFYTGLRQKMEYPNHFPVTPQMLEGTKSLATLLAKSDGNSVVGPNDVNSAIELLTGALGLRPIEAESYEFDADYVDSGASKSQSKSKKSLSTIINEICDEQESNGKKPHAPREAILGRAEEEGVSRDKAEKELDRKTGVGRIAEPVTDCYYVVGI